MIRFFDFLINSNFFISLCSVSLFLFYALKNQADFFLSSALLVFTLTYLGYHLLHWIPYKKGYTTGAELVDFYSKYRIYTLITVIIAAIAALYGLKDLSTSGMLVLLVAGITLLLYERVFFRSFSLRTIPYLKPFIIAFVWALMSAGLFENIVFTSLLDSFIFIFLLSVPFDIKDLEFDQSQQVSTFPMLLKEKLTIILLTLYCSYGVINYIITAETFSLVSIPIYALLLKYAPRYPRLYYLGFDGLILIRFVLYLAQY